MQYFLSDTNVIQQKHPFLLFNRIHYFYPMQIKRAIISFVLIFSYSLGFAQSLIPHCSVTDAEHSHIAENTHQHKHKEAHDDSHESHTHISHDNHFDEGIYDLLICLMSDSHHGASDCCTQHVTSNASNLTIVLSHSELAKVISTFVAVFAIVEEKEPTLLSDYNVAFYASPEINAQSLRGPPFYS